MMVPHRIYLDAEYPDIKKAKEIKTDKINKENLTAILLLAINKAK